MSLPDARRRRGAGIGFSPTGQRTALGYWVPLAVTVGVATAGIAAWIWSERSDEDEEDDLGEQSRDDLDEQEDGFPAAPGPGGEDMPSDIANDDAGMMARMHNTLRRTPSPQQIFDGASKRVAAGVAAAGAFVGGLTSIREENRGDFEDHSRWSEEVESRDNERSQQADEAPTMSGALPTPRGATPGKKKSVAIVVSSASSDGLEDSTFEHASILSHLPEHIDENTKIFVLIYAPGLKHGVNKGTSPDQPLSMASSYSNINPEDAASSGELPTVEPRQMDESEGKTPLFKTLYSQALAIVDKENTIMPFSTESGYVHLVRHLSPELVYVQESLAGKDGSAAQHISGWVRQVVVVVGDEGGRGGLIDSDDESALADNGEKWWQKEGVTGIGKRIDVVDVLRTGLDWRRRVRGLD